MATPAQITANHENALTNGLFTAHAYIRPEEHAEYTRHISDFQTRLAPDGITEQTFATEIAGAAWRLRRCGILEQTAAEPTESDRKSIDRARAGALNAMRKAMAELRHLQTERQVRNLVFPVGSDLSDLGLSTTREALAANIQHHRARLLAEQVDGMDATISGIHEACAAPGPARQNVPVQEKAPAAAPENSFCKTLPPAQTIGRNTLCPCKSGQKFKRCCGLNAPAILNKAA